MGNGHGRSEKPTLIQGRPDPPARVQQAGPSPVRKDYYALAHIYDIKIRQDSSSLLPSIIQRSDLFLICRPVSLPWANGHGRSRKPALAKDDLVLLHAFSRRFRQFSGGIIMLLRTYIVSKCVKPSPVHHPAKPSVPHLSPRQPAMGKRPWKIRKTRTCTRKTWSSCMHPAGGSVTCQEGLSCGLRDMINHDNIDNQ